MDVDAHLDDLVAPLRADTVSGAASVARAAADVMRRAAADVPADSVEELRPGLERAAIKVLDAQPSMAPLVRLVQDVLAAAGDADTVDEARSRAREAAEAFRERVGAASSAVAERAAHVLPAEGTVATFSASSTVREALLRGASAERRIVCFESRPMTEGRGLAESLADAGLEVTFAVDAAAFSLVPTCDTVVLGADSVGDHGVVNKVGSAVLAHAARAAGVPVYVLCDTTKLLPVGFPQMLEDDRPASEVWEGAPAGVSVWNRYFEAVPLSLVTAVVTDRAVLRPSELAAVRESMPFPDFLRRWAKGR